MREFFVYIVKCSDGLYYTGVTNDISRRIQEHNSDLNTKSFTFRRRPVDLVFYETFNDPYSAFRLEKQIKGWSRRKKEALINRDWDKLVELSKNYQLQGKKKGKK